MCDVYGKSKTPYDQWNAYVQHESSTPRPLQVDIIGMGFLEFS